MKRIPLLLLAFASIAFAERDPFWPIDYVPPSETPEVTETPTPEVPVGPTEEELRKQLEQKIKEALDRKATVRARGKLSALVGSQLVSEGDILTEVIEGQTFRLRVKILTEDNIVLEPIR